MQEVSQEVRRFQEIKARERRLAIEETGKDKSRLANPKLSESQVNAVYRRAMEIEARKNK